MCTLRVYKEVTNFTISPPPICSNTVRHCFRHLNPYPLCQSWRQHSPYWLLKEHLTNLLKPMFMVGSSNEVTMLSVHANLVVKLYLFRSFLPIL